MIIKVYEGDDTSTILVINGVFFASPDSVDSSSLLEKVRSGEADYLKTVWQIDTTTDKGIPL